MRIYRCVIGRGRGRGRDFDERNLNLHLEGSVRDLCDVTRDGIIGVHCDLLKYLGTDRPPIYEKKGKRWGTDDKHGCPGVNFAHSPSNNSNHLNYPYATSADRHRKSSVIAPSTSVYLGIVGRDKTRKLMAVEGDSSLY